MKKQEQEWEEMGESGYVWPRPKRISVYIFDAQLKMMRKIAKEKKISLRYVFFECFQAYIGTYHFQDKEIYEENDSHEKKE